MCTAITYKTKDFYFGRTLDYEFSYKEEITVTPRNFPLLFRNSTPLKEHYAIIGMAHVENGYPLYYDAANEKGLCMAGLNFVGNAFYRKPHKSKENITHFELIPYLLGRCKNIKDAKALISKINITDIPFSSAFPIASLHWIIADKTGCITVEAVKSGLKVFENKVGVLTNNPPFEHQLSALNNYIHLSSVNPKSTFSKSLKLNCYSRGMGALGLPGDFSSQSRFVRGAFVKLNSVSDNTESSGISQFFHILDSVSQPRGCSVVAKGEYDITIYSSCINADKGIYYYTTYDNRQINAVDMKKEQLDSDSISCYPLIKEQKINRQN